MIGHIDWKVRKDGDHMRTFMPQGKKRRVGKKIRLPAFLFLLFFPFFTGMITGNKPAPIVPADYTSDAWVEVDRPWGQERIPLEEYLIGMMAATIPLEYEREVLKAQAVMLRSWCLSLAAKENGYDIIPGEELEQAYLSIEDFQAIWPEEFEAKRRMIQEIVEETGGMVLVRQGQIVAAPFFRVSSGSTRKVDEYQAHAEQWDYLLAISCPQDVEAQEYLGRVEIKESVFMQKMGKLLQIDEWTLNRIVLYRDSADYVKTVEIGDRRISGEEFRDTFGLASSCFTLEKQEEVIVIKTRGMGHGFGFCQYYANLLAGQGQTYGQLLDTFFSGLKIEKI